MGSREPPARVSPLVADEHGAGPAVVLLHGQPGDGRDWDAVVDQLAGRVLALTPDRPGYGRTGGPAAGFAANADAVTGLLDRRGLSRATLVGHSWGGGVALAVAQRHPDRVHGLVLVSSIGGEASLGPVDRCLAAPVVGPLLTIVGMTALRAAAVRRLLASVHAPGNPKAVESLRPGWTSSWRSFVAEERWMLRELPGLVAALPAVRAPAVVVLGEADRVVRPASQEALAVQLSADVVRLAGFGHLLPREAPAQVAEAILRIASYR